MVVGSAQGQEANASLATILAGRIVGNMASTWKFEFMMRSNRSKRLQRNIWWVAFPEIDSGLGVFFFNGLGESGTGLEGIRRKGKVERKGIGGSLASWL